MGGTGAIGDYLIPQLLRDGHKVYITSRSGGRNGINTHFIIGDAKDYTFLEAVLANKRYDAIVDFMVYSTTEFNERAPLLLNNTDQYVYISSYRVFSNKDKVITENTPQLLNVSEDSEFLSTDEYALSKARGEVVLQKNKQKNWTIVRPSITYSKKRFQLGVLEANIFVRRALEGKKIVFPQEMLDKKTTMTWAGDAAKMISMLILNKKALGEDFNVVTAENPTWREVIEYYQKTLKLEVVYVTLKNFLKIYPQEYQVIYDRMYDRVMDNGKILSFTGLSSSELAPLDKTLNKELKRFIKHPYFSPFDETLDSGIDLMTHSKIYTIAKKIKPRTRLRKIKNKIRVRSRVKELKRKAHIRTRLRKVKHNIRNSKKDGVIITLPGFYNYGNLLQRYALKKFLEKKGYKFDSIILPDLDRSENEHHHSELKRFVFENIGDKKFDDLGIHGYKNYIVGSDQVWRNWWGNWELFSIYFLEFLGDDTKANRLSYAASFGVDNLKDAGIKDDNVDKIRKLLDKFSGLSVREASAISLIKEIKPHIKGDKQAKLVLDPVLMLRSKDYDELIDNKGIVKNGSSKIFSYILDQNTEKREFITRIADFYDKSYTIVNPSPRKKYISVEEWLSGFRYSEFIITDSFHGAVLSIIYNKEFVIIGNKSRGWTRFESLLSTLALPKDRLINEDDLGNISVGDLAPIEWSTVNRNIEALRKDSEDWIIQKLI